MPAGKDHSGFLSDYTRLKPNAEFDNTTSYVSSDPVKNVHKYVAILIEPVIVYVATDADAKAIPDNGRAALANWRPILRYALTVFVFGGVLPTIAATVLAMVLPAPAGRALALALMLPYVFFFVATLHISDYVSYRDVFHPGETLVPGADAGAAPPPS